MNAKLYFIAKEIVERLEHETKHAQMLHCTEVSLVICDYYADTSSSIKQYILETTWKDFFEDVWEKNKKKRIVYPEPIGNATGLFVENLCDAARNHVVGLIPWITMELFHAGFEDYECGIIDQEDSVLFVKAKVK